MPDRVPQEPGDFIYDSERFCPMGGASVRAWRPAGLHALQSGKAPRAARGIKSRDGQSITSSPRNPSTLWRKNTLIVSSCLVEFCCCCYVSGKIFHMYLIGASFLFLHKNNMMECSKSFFFFPDRFQYEYRYSLFGCSPIQSSNSVSPFNVWNYISHKDPKNCE